MSVFHYYIIITGAWQDGRTGSAACCFGMTVKAYIPPRDLKKHEWDWWWRPPPLYYIYFGVKPYIIINILLLIIQKSLEEKMTE